MTPLVTENISSIQPYLPGKPIEEVQREYGLTEVAKLASNENAYGPSPKALEALRHTLGSTHRYPDGGAYYLREKISQKMAIPREQLIFGNGTTELVELIAKAFLSPEDLAMVSEQSFIMYKIAVQAINGNLTIVPLKESTYDLPALAGAVDDRTKLLFIANPNNPTGTYVNRRSVETLLASVPEHVLIIIDQAYLEYVEEADYPNAQDFLENHPNLIVLRTFSKVYGLAGMRIGYAMAAPHLIELLNKVRSPFNTNMLSQAAAIAALDDHDHIERSIEGNRTERKFLADGLTELGVSFIPSVTNFCLMTTSLDAQRLFQTLIKRGVIVRPMGAYDLPNSIRVTFGRHDENLRFLEALQDALRESEQTEDA